MQQRAKMRPAFAIALLAGGALLSVARSASAQVPVQASPASREGGAVASLPAQVRRDCWLVAATGEPEIPCEVPFDANQNGMNNKAVLVREVGGGRRRGIAILMASSVQILGAGHGAGSLGADLGWMKAWTVLHPRDPDSSLDHDLLLLEPVPSPHPAMPAGVLVALRDEEAENVDLSGPHDRRGSFVAMGLTDRRWRFVALDLLERYDVTPAKRWLLPGLDDPDELVRLGAAGVLAASKVGDAVGGIAAWLAPGRPDVSPFTWRQIALDLGQLGSPAGIPALERALGDAAPEVREAAVWALGEIGGPTGVELIGGHVGDPDPRVRRAAVAALGVAGGPGIGPGIALILGNAFADPDQRTRLGAVESASKLGLRDLIPAFIERLKDPDGEVQYAAVGAVGKLGARQAAPELVPLLLARGPRQVRHHALCWSPGIWLPLDCAAARALVKIGDPAGIAEARKRVPHCLVEP
jgi:HEAT repeats